MRTLTYQNRDVVEIDSGEGAVPRLYSLQDVPGLGGIRRLGGERLQAYAVFYQVFLFLKRWCQKNTKKPLNSKGIILLSTTVLSSRPNWVPDSPPPHTHPPPRKRESLPTGRLDRNSGTLLYRYTVPRVQVKKTQARSDTPRRLLSWPCVSNLLQI
jgi:hypothetical protein